MELVRSGLATGATRLAPPDWRSMRTTVLVCAECGRGDSDRKPGWEGHLVDLDDDGEDEILFFCPDCAAREFGIEGGGR